MSSAAARGSDDSSGPGPWRRTTAYYRVLAVAVFGIGMAAATGRFDLVVLVAPIVLAGTLTMPHTLRLASRPAAAAGVARGIVSGSRLPVRITLTGAAEAELVTISVPESTRNPVAELVTIAGGEGRDDGAGTVELLQGVRVRGWGSSLISRPDLAAVTADGLCSVGPLRSVPINQTVLPGVPPQDPLPLPPITGGFAGSHLSRRPGQGSDLVDLRDFAPGDRMRSVHWRAFARLGKLYTRRTMSETEAEIALCLDIRHVVGPRRRVEPQGRFALAVTSWRTLSRWGRRGRGARLEARHERWDALEEAEWHSLDLTVQAVTAVAAAQLGGGDRVSVRTVDTGRRLLRHGSGQRQVDRVRYFLTSLRSTTVRMLDVEHWLLRPGSVVILFSPLVDDVAADAARTARSRGHRVIVVDTLPARSIVDAAVPRELRGLGLLSVARGLRIEKILAAGIPVLRWDEGAIENQMARALTALRARR